MTIDRKLTAEIVAAVLTKLLLADLADTRGEPAEAIRHSAEAGHLLDETRQDGCIDRVMTKEPKKPGVDECAAFRAGPCVAAGQVFSPQKVV